MTTKKENTQTLDIVALVQEHPLTKLSGDYGSDLIYKIKERFSTTEQQLFIGNFYVYLNYDTKKDFVIELNKVWNWMGFSRLDHAKALLTNNFTENSDYKIEKTAPEFAGAVLNGGQNRENILLTVRCFKKLCLKAKTKKSNEIHDYYLELEEIINETIADQSSRLVNQLSIKNQELALKDQQINKKDKERENILILNFKGRHVVYLIKVEQNIIKFGYTKDIEDRMEQHRNTFGKDIILHAIYESVYNREFELIIKEDSAIKPHIIQKKYKDKNKIELVELSDTFNLKHLENEIERIKQTVNGDLVANLMKENQELKLKMSEYEINESNNGTTRLKEQIRKLEDRVLFYKKKNDRLKETRKIVKFQENLTKELDVTIPTNLICTPISEKTYRNYVNERLTIDPEKKCALVQLYEDFYKWYKNDEIIMYTSESGITFKNMFKDELAENIINITNLEISKIHVINKYKGINLAGYAGFIGIGIKEIENDNKTVMYKESVYKEYIDNNIILTNKLKDRLGTREVLDNFMTWMKSKNYEINEKSVGKSRYANVLTVEFTTFITKLLNITHNPTGRKRYKGMKCIGVLLGIQIGIQIAQK